jgi:acetolactate synthase-1/2/3 large subunit
MALITQKVKLSDYVISQLKKEGIDTVFGVTGGAVVHFFDSIEKMGDMNAIFFNHEQSASFAVEAFAKMKKSLGGGIFTTGPGGTNAITGLAAAWLDSIPCIFISGQVRTTQTVRGRNLRQVGSQELDIISIVRPITKYAVTVYDSSEIRFHLEKAIYLARTGRPGPVWIDIPVDLQWVMLEPEGLKSFDALTDEFSPQKPTLTPLQLKSVLRLIQCSKRPLVLVGYGVRLAGAEEELLHLLETLQVPCVQTWSMADFLPSQNLLNIGRPGLSGQRGANLAIQNADLIISIGSHLNASITGTRPELFARDAKLVVVDIDQNELENCAIPIDVALQTDAKDFILALRGASNCLDSLGSNWQEWGAVCRRYRLFNRVALDYADNQEYVNSYYFKHQLSEISKPGDVFVVDGGGTVVYSAFQSLEIKESQRIILSTGLCSMGSGLPEAIGVAFAAPRSRVFCLVGDGSFPFNMQELQVIRDCNLSIKIFVFNNNGYVSIRTTQKDFLDARFIGSSQESGLHLPEVEKIAAAFGLPFRRIDSQINLAEQIGMIVSDNFPLICEVLVSPDQEIVPRQGFLKRADGVFEPQPIENMYPFLGKDVLESLMIVPPLEEAKLIPLGKEINLMRRYPRIPREIDHRTRSKENSASYVGISEDGNLVSSALFEELISEKSRIFGRNYFDGERNQGYGGYYYDERFWRDVAIDISTHYNLKAGNRVLDVGCAKGFLLHELKKVVPGLLVFGVDISDYAVRHALPTVRSDLSVCDASKLRFPDRYFDLVLSINTLSELPIQNCREAIMEINRVSKGQAFITLNSWRNEREKDRLVRWNLTALSNFSVVEWKRILSDVDYRGDYYWFFVN